LREVKERRRRGYHGLEREKAGEKGRREKGRGKKVDSFYCGPTG
jgi:hypothetical protein